LQIDHSMVSGITKSAKRLSTPVFHKAFPQWQSRVSDLLEHNVPWDSAGVSWRFNDKKTRRSWQDGQGCALACVEASLWS
jgi:hypothetical protein